MRQCLPTFAAEARQRRRSGPPSQNTCSYVTRRWFLRSGDHSYIDLLALRRSLNRSKAKSERNQTLLPSPPIRSREQLAILEDFFANDLGERGARLRLRSDSLEVLFSISRAYARTSRCPASSRGSTMLAVAYLLAVFESRSLSLANCMPRRNGSEMRPQVSVSLLAD